MKLLLWKDDLCAGLLESIVDNHFVYILYKWKNYMSKSSPREGFTFSGKYTYDDSEGHMHGSIIRYNDDRLIGLVTDWMNGLTPSQGTTKYILGAARDTDMTFVKIAPIDRGLYSICWALKRDNQNAGLYVGGWVHLEVSRESILLSATPSLQELQGVSIEGFDVFKQDYVDMIIGEGCRSGQAGSINITSRDLRTVRDRLGL